MRRTVKEIAKMMTMLVAVALLSTSTSLAQSNEALAKSLGAKQILSTQGVDANKDGKKETLVHYVKGSATYLEVIQNGKSLTHVKVGGLGEMNKLNVTDIGKNGLVLENYVHFGGTGGPTITAYHLQPDFKLVQVKPSSSPVLTLDSKKNIIVSQDKFQTQYQVTLPSKLSSMLPKSLGKSDYYYKTYGNQYKYTKGIAEIEFCYSATLSVISNATMPFEVRQTYTLEQGKWVLKKLSVLDTNKTGIKVAVMKSQAKAESKVTLETLLSDGKLPDGLIVGKSTTKEIKKIYGEPSESMDFEGAIAMMYKNRTFLVTTSGVLKEAAYNESGSILGLTARKSTQKDVKALLGDQFTVSEYEDGMVTMVSNKAGDRWVNIAYGDNDIVLSISVVSK